MSAQALEALASANRIRMARAHWCRTNLDLPRGEAMVQVGRALLSPDLAGGDLGSFRLEELLTRSVRRFGPRAAERIVRQAGLQNSVLRKRVRRLTSNERRQLAAALGAAVPSAVKRPTAAVGL